MVSKIFWNYLEGYAAGFSLFPASDPNEDARRAYEEVGDALYEAIEQVDREIKEKKK